MDGKGLDQFKNFVLAFLRYKSQRNAEISARAISSFSSTIVNTTPLLKDLYQHITPQYAADWKVIGTLLGLPSGELKTIEAEYPTNVKW